MNVSLRKIALDKSVVGRGRFWLTVACLAVSTAMLAAVLLGCDAVLDVLRRYTICMEGEWDWSMVRLSATAASQLRDDLTEETVGVYGGKYTATADGGASLRLYGTADEFLPMMQTRLVGGRYPLTADELLLDSETAAKTGASVGGKITLTDDAGTSRTMTVVGLYDRSVLNMQLPAGEDASNAFYGIDWQEPRGEDDYRLFSLSTRPDAAYYTRLRALEQQVVAVCPQAYSLFNSSLLTFSGAQGPDGYNGIQKILTVLRLGLIAVVAAASAAMISGSFSISLAARKRTLAMLVSVGATMRQAGTCLFYEAAAIGAVGIPAGLAAGCAALALAFRVLAPMLSQAGQLMGGDITLRLIVKPQWLLVSAAVSFLVLVISASRPMRSFAKESVVGNLLNRGEVKVDRRVRRAGRLMGKVQCAEGRLAVKNAKRSRRVYRATVRSLALCVALLIGAGGLARFIPAAYFAGQDMPSGILSVDYAATEENLSQTELYKRLIKPSSTVDTVTVNEKGYFESVYLPGSVYTERNRSLMNMLGTVREGDAHSALVEFTILPDEEFTRLTGGFSAPAGTIGCVLKNRYFYGGESVTQTNLTVSDQIETQLDDMPATLSVAAVDTRRFVDLRYGDASRLSVLIGRSDAEALFAEYERQAGAPYPRAVRLDYQTPTPSELKRELEALSFDRLYAGDGTANYLLVSDNSLSLLVGQLLRLLLGVALYGFTGFLCLIGIFHMVTSLSTGLSQQRAEFSILAALGMTEKELTKTIMLQGGVYAAEGLLWGIPCGLLLVYGEYSLLRRSSGFLFSVPWWAVALSATTVICAALLTAYPPIHALRKQSVMENIRHSE